MSVSLKDRLSFLELPYVPLHDLQESIIDGSMDLAIGEASQLTVVLSDPKGMIVTSKNLNVNSLVSWGTVKFTIAELTHGPVDGVRATTIVARSKGWQALKNSKEHRGPQKWRNISPTNVMRSEARKAGLKAVMEQTGARGVVSRLPKGQKKGPAVSTLDMADRLAGESGFVFGEVGGTFFFASPSWLGRRKGYTVDTNDGYLLEYPTMSRNVDDRDAPRSVTLSIVGNTPQEVLLPFTAVQLKGVPWKFDGRYIVNTVTIPFGRADPGTVELVAPKDPKKEPRETDGTKEGDGK